MLNKPVERSTSKGSLDSYKSGKNIYWWKHSRGLGYHSLPNSRNAGRLRTSFRHLACCDRLCVSTNLSIDRWSVVLLANHFHTQKVWRRFHPFYSRTWCLPLPLSPNSDQYQISPCSINAQSIREVMRIKDMITQNEFSRNSTTFPHYCYNKCMGTRKENLYFDIGDYWLSPRLPLSLPHCPPHAEKSSLCFPACSCGNILKAFLNLRL